MKRIWSVSIAVLLALAVQAENRIYFFRAKELPQEVQTVDLRPDNGLTQLTLNNIYADADARYALFTKRADSWWQIMVETAKGKTVDLSAVNADWYLKIKMRRTVNYTLTLVLAGAGTANGYALTTSKVPANGEWVELAIPLSDFPVLPIFSEKYAGRLLQIHSDLGYAGDVVGIDYCYLTNDPSGKDEGTVLPPKRYYVVTNSRTPLTGTAYTVVDYSGRLQPRANGWQQWSYIPFPYYSMEAEMPVALQLQRTEECPLADVDEDWYLVAQVRTDMQGEFAYRLYLPDGLAFMDTVRSDEWVRDGKTWNRWFVPLDRIGKGAYEQSTDILFALSSPAPVPAGEWTMASLMLTNDAAADDPAPLVPADPSQEARIYLLNDGTPLPEMMTCIDYRLDQTNYLSVAYGNNTTRKTSDAFLTMLPTNGWWSADISAKTPVDLTAVDDTWMLHTRVRTTSAYRPVNIILYKEGNAQLNRYQLTEAMLPVAQNGTWFDFDIPMSAFLAAGNTLVNYTARILSFHSDNGGTSGVEVSMEYFYFSKEGESRPDPQPGLPTLDEPEIVPVTEPEPQGWSENPRTLPHATKVWHNNRLFIRVGEALYDVLGRRR